jgi:hypothetical protein
LTLPFPFPDSQDVIASKGVPSNEDAANSCIASVDVATGLLEAITGLVEANAANIIPQDRRKVIVLVLRVILRV